MRVIHVSHTAYPGGAELALVRLLRADPPWKGTVYAPSAGDAFDSLPRHGVRVSTVLPALPTGGTRSRDPFLAVRYLAALRAGASALRRDEFFRSADLVHANTAAAAIMCALADRRKRSPLVVHLRDLVSAESLGRFGLASFTRIALARADGVIANSQSTLLSATPWIPPAARRAVIQSPMGVPRRVTAPLVNEEVRTVGMIGRLQQWKGQHVFLEAFARCFRGTQTRAHLAGAALFGEADYEEELRALAARLGIARQVSFLGHVDDIGRFLDSVDVLVHASTRAEPMGQSVVQGLAAGKPVIATAGGGPSEWIQPGVNGLLVQPNDVDALASALGTLAGSSDLRAALVAGAVRTAGIMTDEECVAQHASVFQEVWEAHAAGSVSHEGRAR